jgi:hypothetical protein
MLDFQEIQRAREVIGEDAAEMTDAQLADAIAALDAVADMVIDCFLKKCRQTAVDTHKEAAVAG